MATELSYVLLTPYTMRKSRTGGIISRLISRTGLDLVAARVFTPGAELTEKFAAGQVTDSDMSHRAAQELIQKYVLSHFTGGTSGTKPRVIVLVFRGEDAVKKIKESVGHILNERTAGETIRDTYGDYITDAQGNVTYFEPGALAPPDAASAERDLRLLAQYSDSEGGVMDAAIEFPKGANVEKTLVLIKPDNFQFPNARPGGVIDLFSRTGLYIIGMKVHHMSCAQAEEFYGPVLAVLQDKLRGRAASIAKGALEPKFEITFTPEQEKALGDLLGPITGRENWEDIVEFMSGRRPSTCPADLRNAPGTAKIVAIIYQGVDAVAKIREVLGPTDPSKAPHGTIRREYGQSIMVNAAHASDAAENAVRETGIIQINENNFRTLIEAAYAKQ